MRVRAYLLTRNWLLARLLAARIKSCAAMRLSSGRERERERECVCVYVCDFERVAAMRMRAYLLTRNWLLGRLLAAWIKNCAAMRLSSGGETNTSNRIQFPYVHWTSAHSASTKHIRGLSSQGLPLLPNRLRSSVIRIHLSLSLSLSLSIYIYICTYMYNV